MGLQTLRYGNVSSASRTPRFEEHSHGKRRQSQTRTEGHKGISEEGDRVRRERDEEVGDCLQPEFGMAPAAELSAVGAICLIGRDAKHGVSSVFSSRGRHALCFP